MTITDEAYDRGFAEGQAAEANAKASESALNDLLCDKDIVNDLIGVFAKYGFNCDRKTLSQVAFIIVSDRAEFLNRLENIKIASDVTVTADEFRYAINNLNA